MEARKMKDEELFVLNSRMAPTSKRGRGDVRGNLSHAIIGRHVSSQPRSHHVS
jgi:hypothetical protein